MGFSVEVSVSVLTVFAQGLLSFFSPCVLPLLPLYIGYLSGGAAASGEGTRFSRGRAAVNTLFFVLGVSFAFFLLGLGMSAVGSFFGSRQRLFARIGGVIVLLFGLYQLGVFGPIGSLQKERRLPLALDKMAMSPVTALLMGFVFSFSWTPCVGPALSSVLLMAASASSRALGFVLIGVYTLGFVIPFLAVGIFAASLLEVFRKHAGVVRWTGKVGGALMLLMGVLMLTGTMDTVSGYFARLSDDPAPGVVTETVEETAAPAPTASPVPTETADTPEETERELFPAPDFTLYDQYGNLHTLSDYQGQVVFLNFWATWCPPCRAEMPDIEALYEKYTDAPDSGVVILGVAFPGLGQETDTEGVKAFLEENGYSYPVVMDTEAELLYNYGITAFPTTFMIAADGTIYGYLTGAMDAETMESIIQQTIDAAE